MCVCVLLEKNSPGLCFIIRLHHPDLICDQEMAGMRVVGWRRGGREWEREGRVDAVFRGVERGDVYK